jgi:hypothetical protein
MYVARNRSKLLFSPVFSFIFWLAVKKRKTSLTSAEFPFCTTIDRLVVWYTKSSKKDRVLQSSSCHHLQERECPSWYD